MNIKTKLKIIPITLLLMMLAPLSLLPDDDVKEYQNKAVFLTRFTRYINWPEESGMSNTSKPFIISVIGKNPFVIRQRDKKSSEDWLQKAYKEKSIENKKVEIRYISEIKEIAGSHILFISKSEKKNLKEIISEAAQHFILTVADTDGFAKKGVHINFYLSKNRLRFEINETGIRSSGFHVKYQLLKIAKIVNRMKKRR